MQPYVRVAVAILSTAAAGLIGYTFVDAGAISWYASLTKPALTPPMWVFGFVWTLLYIAMALALCIIWLKPSTPSTQGWVRFYFLQLLFNAAWTLFFFKLHSVLVAFVDILFLGFIVLSLIAGAYDHDRRAMNLLLPYFFWILFAGYLTLNIWLLN